MPGLVPGIHVFEAPRQAKTWMAGINPAMTMLETLETSRQTLFKSAHRNVI